MQRLLIMLSALTLITASAWAGQTSRSTQQTIDGLNQIIHGKRQSTELQITLIERDSYGALTQVKINNDKLTINRSRIGRSDDVRQMAVAPQDSYALLVMAVSSEVWMTQVKERHGLDAEIQSSLRIGVVGTDGFSIVVPTRHISHYAAFSKLRHQILSMAAKAKNRVPKSSKPAAPSSVTTPAPQK